MLESTSPIAADGGFGPMNDEESEHESDIITHETEQNAKLDINDSIGMDFDDFEAGDDEDFGDFDDGFQQSSALDEEPQEPASSIPPIQSLPHATSPFVSNVNATIEGTVSAHLIVTIEAT